MTLNNKASLSTTLQIVEPTSVNRRMANNDTFVVNLVAAWCPDCTEKQALHIDGFAQKMKLHNIDVLQVTVQLSKGNFIGDSHEQLTNLFGGHGFPRTVLINDGKVVDKDNVEIFTELALSTLVKKFVNILSD